VELDPRKRRNRRRRRPGPFSPLTIGAALKTPIQMGVYGFRQPTPQPPTDDGRQLVEFGWRLFHAPSLMAFKLGEAVATSPRLPPVVRQVGGLVSFGALVVVFAKLYEWADS